MNWRNLSDPWLYWGVGSGFITRELKGGERETTDLNSCYFANGINLNRISPRRRLPQIFTSRSMLPC